MAQLAQEAEIDQQVQKVLKQPLSKQAKQSLIKSIRQSSIAQSARTSSMSTIMNISMSMVGSTTMVVSTLFYKTGIITSVIVAFIIAGISCKTTQLLVAHNTKNEMDLPDSLIRILGPKWRNIFNISNIILLWASGMIYTILVCSQLYSIVQLIGSKADIQTAKQDEISYSQLSYQWVGLFFICLIFPLLLQKKLGIILKMMPYGFISVASFILFSIYKGLQRIITNYEEVSDNLILFSWNMTDIANLAGSLALAFMVQSLIVPIMKNNANPQHNNRDVALGFFNTFWIYSIAGVFGAIAICGLEKQEGTQGSTLMDFYSKEDPLVIVIKSFYLLQLSVVFPVLQFVTRSQFFQLVYPLERTPKRDFYIFTFGYAITCLLIQSLNVNLTLIIGLCGSVIGLFQEYIIPILMHMTCLYGKEKSVEDFQRQQSKQIQQSLGTVSDISDNLISNVDLSILKVDDEDVKCNDHKVARKKLSKQTRQLIYGPILVLGFAILVGQLVNIFKS